jgi:hypothetical protein
MRELNMRDRHWCQKMKVSSTILKVLKLSKFSDIWTINKAHNKFLSLHELEMRLNFQIISDENFE